MRQNRNCRGSKIQVLWHESTTMMLMGPRCLTTLNPGPERPGGWLGIRLPFDDAGAVAHVRGRGA